MAIGATITNLAFKWIGVQPEPVVPLSIESDWVALSNTTSANSAAELLRPASVDDATIFPCEVPQGATRFIWRIRFLVSVTTLTTDPVVRFYGEDSNGVPVRLDATASNAAGQEIDISGSTPSSTMARDDTYYYSPPADRAGIDLLGCKKLYALVDTASNYNAGGAALEAYVQVKFLN